MYNFQDFFWFSFLVELKNLIFESLIIFIVLSHFFHVIYCGYIILCHYRTLIYEKIEKKSYIDGEISLFFLYKNEKKKKKNIFNKIYFIVDILLFFLISMFAFLAFQTLELRINVIYGLYMYENIPLHKVTYTSL